MKKLVKNIDNPAVLVPFWGFVAVAALIVAAKIGQDSYLQAPLIIIGAFLLCSILVAGIIELSERIPNMLRS